MVQIVPTVIFLLLLAPPPLFFSKLGATKGGYWFTFALFEFFLICLFSERYLKKYHGLLAVLISIAAFCYDAYYNRYFQHLGVLTDILGALSFITWRYYLFFYIGTWIKRHFDDFIRLTSKLSVIIVNVVGFTLIAWHPHSGNPLIAYLIFSVGGILGMTMLFTVFRLIYTTPHLSPLTSHLSPLKFIGTRTLDIYLLHYFFLPRFLLAYAPQLHAFDSKVLEFVIAILLSLVVVGGCLLVSYVIRLNSFLGHYLFGVKYERKP